MGWGIVNSATGAGGGGIAPNNMKEFKAVIGEGGKPQITATLPEDTVIQGMTLCTVAGAVICRGEKDYPKKEYEGEKIKDLKAKTTTFVDETAKPNGTYFYTAFPYSDQGTYNRNPANRVAVNEPSPMAKFVASSAYDAEQKKVTISVEATLPKGVAGAFIRYRTDKFPTDEHDGQPLGSGNITVSQTLKLENAQEGVTYYFLACPYTSTGAFNRDIEKNRTSVVAQKRDYLYGYDITLANENPSARVTYPAGVDNTGFTPAKMNFSSGKFEPGSWNITPGHHFMPKPCMLGYDGKVKEWLDPADYTKQTNGQPSHVANAEFAGNAMMQWPKIYTLRWEKDGVYHFCCSDVPIDKVEVGAPPETPDSDCWCNYDREDNVIPWFYTPIYFGSNVSGKLRSLSGKPGMASQGVGIGINMAKKNGTDWYTEFIVDRMLITDLLVMMSKSTDSQKTYGNGCCGADGPISSGSMDKNGMFWGSNDKTSGVKCFGMENYWGNIWHQIAGLVLVDGKQYVKLTRGTHDGSKVTDYNVNTLGQESFNGADYSNNYIPVETPIISTSFGSYIGAMKSTAYGRFPYKGTGSNNTYEADTISTNTKGTRYAFVGGSYHDNFGAGLFAVDMNNEYSVAYPDIGAALSCKPLLGTEV